VTHDDRLLFTELLDQGDHVSDEVEQRCTRRRRTAGPAVVSELSTSISLLVHPAAVAASRG